MTNHIGTTKINTESGIETVPVFDPVDLEEPAWFRVETPNGTGAIRLVDIPDATLEEYRAYTPNGLKAVATLLGELPDSARYYWDPASWSQGESTWTDEVAGLGMSMNGDFQAATLSDGSESISGDGADDHGLANLSNAGSILNNGSWEFEVEYTATGRMNVVGNSPEPYVIIQLNGDGDFGSDNGNVATYIRDQAGNTLGFAASSNPGLNDGNRHVVTVVINDSSTNDVGLLIDGTNVPVSVPRSQGPTISNAFQSDVGFWARNINGTIDQYADAELGRIAIHDQPITEQSF